jgi:hypothetical protein
MPTTADWLIREASRYPPRAAKRRRLTWNSGVAMIDSMGMIWVSREKALNEWCRALFVTKTAGIPQLLP